MEKSKGKQSISLPYQTKCGFKLDFSTGLVASGLYSPTYKLQNVGNDSLEIKEELGKQKFSIGIALLSHAYFRLTRNINPAITSGLVVNLSSQNINYVFGLSTLLGSEQRLILSGGAIAGRVKALPSYQKENTVFDKAIWTTGSEVFLIDKTKLSWWLGITYNLGANRGEKTIEF